MEDRIEPWDTGLHASDGASRRVFAHLQRVTRCERMHQARETYDSRIRDLYNSRSDASPDPVAASKRPKRRRVVASLARANLAELLEAVGERRARILIDRRGRPPVALVPIDALLQLELIEASVARSDRKRRGRR